MRYTFIWLPFLILLVLAGFGLVNWLHIPTDSLVNWVIGIAIFSWLLAITTVPWNVYFQAKEVLAEAAFSAEEGIRVDAQQQEYAATIARRSLWVALSLHFVSAVALYLLALWQVSAIGYFGSIAALLLTALRPAVRTYQFLVKRLGMIQTGLKYPREDVLELRERVIELENSTKDLIQRLDLEDPTSWISIQQRQWEALRQDLTHLASAQEEFKAINQAEHARLSREAQQAIAQLSEDSQFLNQVRELIRFVKSA
ncbi:MAG: hypothetical protein ACFB8W_22900 [Elainellaceae cyanobacterium]